MSTLRIGDEFDVGYLNDRSPTERITVRRSTETCFDVLRVRMDPHRTPSENERRIVTYGNQELAIAHARETFAYDSKEGVR